MIAKLAVLLIATLMSMNAWAGYTKYDFTGPLEGFFVQRDDNQAIALFSFNMITPITLHYDPEWYDHPPETQQWSHHFFPLYGDGEKRLTGASTNFRSDGPTNFDIHDDFGGDQLTDFSIRFSRASDGVFTYEVDYTQWVYISGGYGEGAGTLMGTVSVGTLWEGLAESLDHDGGYYEGMPRIVPEYMGPANEVPEPGSLSLVAAAGLMAMVCRKRRPAKTSLRRTPYTAIPKTILDSLSISL